MRRVFFNVLLLIILLLPLTVMAQEILMGSINLEVGDEERLTIDPSGEVNVNGTWAKTGNAVIITAASYSDRSCVVKAINAGESKVTWNGYVRGEKCGFYWIINVKDSGNNSHSESLSLNATDVLLKIGETFELIATYSDYSIGWNNAPGNDGVILAERMSSNQDNVAKFRITAVGEGTSAISAYLIDKSNGVVSVVPNSKTTCNFTVKGYVKDYTFQQKNSEGHWITYQLVDANEMTCQVYGVYKEEEGTLTIPSNVNGFKVVAIRDSAFVDSKLSKVIVPSTVTSIGNRAFYYSNIETIILNDGLVCIGDEAFCGCMKLSKVSFPSTLTRIGDMVFNFCIQLGSVTGVSQLEYIGADAFAETPMYDKLPTGLLYIGKVLYKFKRQNYNGVKMAINVREGTTMISGKAFSDIYARDTIDISIPASTKFIQCELNNYYDFLKWGLMCSPNSITVAPENSVYDSRNNCNALMHTATNTLLAASKMTTIPEDTKIIGGGAFRYYGNGQRGMKIDMVIPHSVDSIGEMAFSGSDAINSIVIGSGVNGIGENIFYGCNNLRKIIVSPENKTYDSREDCNAIIEKSTNKLLAGCTTTVIPSSVKSLGNYAFSTGGYQNFIKTIDVPDNVEEIGDNAFRGLLGVQVITLGKGIKKIGKRFVESYSDNMSLCLLCETPPIINTDSYNNYTFVEKDYENLTLYVPEGLLVTYMMTDGWAEFKNIKEGQPEDPSGIHNLQIDRNNSPIFSLSGQRLTAPKKGINIVGGRKVVVK